MLQGLLALKTFVDNVQVKPTTSDTAFRIIDKTQEITHRMLSRLSSIQTFSQDCNGQTRNFTASWFILHPKESLPAWGVDLSAVLEQLDKGLPLNNMPTLPARFAIERMAQIMAYPMASIGNKITGQNYETPIVYLAKNQANLRTCMSVGSGTLKVVLGTAVTAAIGAAAGYNISQNAPLPNRLKQILGLFVTGGGVLAGGSVGLSTALMVNIDTLVIPFDFAKYLWLAKPALSRFRFSAFMGTNPLQLKIDSLVFLPISTPIAANERVLLGGQFDGVQHNVGANLTLTMAALTGTLPHSFVHFLSDTMNMEMFELMYCVMNNKTSLFSQSFFQDYLNSAPTYNNPNNLYNPTGRPYTIDSLETGGWYMGNRWSHPTPAHKYLTGGKQVYKGFDYMMLYNLYRLQFDSIGNPLPKYTNTASCDCKPQPLNVPQQIVNTLPPFERYFIDYAVKNISTPQFSTFTTTIQPAGTLTLHNDFVFCRDTTANVYLDNYGKLIIGGGLLREKSIASIRQGTALKLNSGSLLKINNNSKLVIEKDAELVITPNTTIQLLGNNAVLEVKGKIRCLGNSTLTVTGNGYILLVDNASIVGTDGINSNIVINGVTKNQRLIVTGGNILFANSLTNCRIQNGKIEGGGKITLQSNNCTLNNLLIENTNLIVSNNKILATNNTFTQCIPFGLSTHITANSGSTSQITNNIFLNCDEGLITTGTIPRVTGCLFKNCNIGWNTYNQTGSITAQSNNFMSDDPSNTMFGFLATNNLGSNLLLRKNTFGGLYAPVTLLYGTNRLECNKIGHTTTDLGGVNATYGVLSMDKNAKNEFLNNDFSCIVVDKLNMLELDSGNNVIGTDIDPRSSVVASIKGSLVFPYSSTAYICGSSNTKYPDICITSRQNSLGNSNLQIDPDNNRNNYVTLITTPHINSSCTNIRAAAFINPIVSIAVESRIMVAEKPISNAIYEALNNISTPNDIYDELPKNDLLGLEQLYSIFKTLDKTEQLTYIEQAITKTLYPYAITAINNAYNHGLISRNTIKNNDTPIVELVTAIDILEIADRIMGNMKEIDNYTKSEEQGNIALQKSILYANAQYFDKSLPILETLINTSTDLENQKKYWQCFINAEFDLWKGTTTPYEYFENIKKCKNALPLKDGAKPDNYVRSYNRKMPDLIIMPNPTYQNSFVKINVPDEKSGSLLIADLYGKIIQNYALTPGIQTIALQGEKLNSGVYMVSLYIDEAPVKQQKWIITK
jgi:hypothetical protein